MIVQIEHIDAVANIEKILAVAGIDGLFVGPYDLSASMGKTGLTTDPEVQEAISKVKQAATRANVRTSQAANQHGAGKALRIAFFGGAVMGLAVAMALCFAERASAQTAGEILKKVDVVGHSKTTEMEMVQKIVTPSGDNRSFKMVSYSANGAEKGLTVYVSPNQVRGMKILSLNDGDDIWTYFPRTNRTRKIASSARNRRVQGSDFTYDDMSGGKMAEKLKVKIIDEEELKGLLGAEAV